MENSCATGALNSAQGAAQWSPEPHQAHARVTDAPRKCCRDGADDYLQSEYGSGMKILHEACVITCRDEDDPWRTERRSNGWNVSDVLASESDTPLCRKERPRSDWNIGDAPFDDPDSLELALVPADSRNPLGRMDPDVLTRERIAALLLPDDGSPRDDGVVERDADRGVLV